jgi:hypothetical protein
VGITMRYCFALMEFTCAILLLPGSIHAVPPVQFSTATYAGAGGPRAIVCADVNGDGKPDLMTVNPTANSVSLLLGIGGGAFQSPTNFPVGTNPLFIAIGDFNTNGQWDIVAANYNAAGSVSMLSGNGDGTFAPAIHWAVGDRPNSIAIGDFNHDHNPDLAVANTVVKTVTVRLGNGDGTFSSETTNSLPGGAYSIVTDDFNGDGKLDFVTASPLTGDVNVLLGNGDGTFGSVSNYHAASVPPFAGNLESVACGDFNNDSIVDLVTANQVDKSSTFLKGLGNGGFLAVATNGVGYSARFVTVGDFNGDGNLDFVTANSGTNISVRLGNGDGTFETNNFFNVGSAQWQVAVADVNGDGKQDLLTANGNANTVSVFLNLSVPALKIVPAGAAIRISWPD